MIWESNLRFHPEAAVLTEVRSFTLWETLLKIDQINCLFAELNQRWFFYDVRHDLFEWSLKNPYRCTSIILF